MPSGVYTRKARPTYDHICELCGCTFTSQAEIRVFCSPSCRNKAQAKPREQLQCAHCKELFVKKYPSQKRKYCSQECVRLERLAQSKASGTKYRARAKNSQVPLAPAEIKQIKTQMLIDQNYICKICPSEVDMKSAFDHCHSSGIPRGVLCNRCNLGIGIFKDDPKLLRNAANYVETA